MNEYRVQCWVCAAIACILPYRVLPLTSPACPASSVLPLSPCYEVPTGACYGEPNIHACMRACSGNLCVAGEMGMMGEWMDGATGRDCHAICIIQQ